MSEPAPTPDPDAPDPDAPEPHAPEPDEPDETGDDAATEAAATADGSREVLEKADKENKRYHKAIAKILGDDPNRHECAACTGLGIVWGDQPAGAASPAQDLELVEAADAEPCPSCNAIGLVLTGSKNPQQATKPCTDCGGRGWRNVIAPPVAVTPLPVAPLAGPAPLSGQWVAGRGFIPYGATEPIVADPNAGQ